MTAVIEVSSQFESSLKSCSSTLAVQVTFTDYAWKGGECAQVFQRKV